MAKSKEKFFLTPYIKILFHRPRVPLSKTLFHSYLFSRLVEIPLIGVLWGLSKFPWIGRYIERFIVQRLSPRWAFKPLPFSDTLAEETKSFKKEKCIEINNKMDVQTKILDITTYNEIIEKFPLSTVAECGCRSVVMNCDSPRHTCLIMRWPSDSEKELIDDSQYKKIGNEEIKELLDIVDKWALVHMTLTFPNQYSTYVCCNCCDCCCVSFRELKANGVPLIVGSNYVAKVDPELCKGCFYCINYRCRFDAIDRINEDGFKIDSKNEYQKKSTHKWPHWSENRRGWGRKIREDPENWENLKKEHPNRWRTYIDPEKCYGCGNCASPAYGCKEGAIKLFPRS